MEEAARSYMGRRANIPILLRRATELSELNLGADEFATLMVPIPSISQINQSSERRPVNGQESAAVPDSVPEQLHNHVLVSQVVIKEKIGK